MLMLECPMMYCNALGFIPAFANVVQNVWRKGVRCHYLWQCDLLRFVVFPYKPPEHTFIIDCYFRQAVPVKEQKFCVALQNNRLCIFPFVQHPLKCFQHFFTHRNNPVTAFRLRRFHIVAHVCNLQKLVVYIDKLFV